MEILHKVSSGPWTKVTCRTKNINNFLSDQLDVISSNCPPNLMKYKFGGHFVGVGRENSENVVVITIETETNNHNW